LPGEKHDDKILDFIKLKAKELKYTSDSTHVLRIALPENLLYKSFIQLLKIMREDQQRRHFESQDYFYIFGKPEFFERYHKKSAGDE
jgi:hypothetical protein